jgi:hypothetical protein
MRGFSQQKKNNEWAESPLHGNYVVVYESMRFSPRASRLRERKGLIQTRLPPDTGYQKQDTRCSGNEEYGDPNARGLGAPSPNKEFSCISFFRGAVSAPLSHEMANGVTKWFPKLMTINSILQV